MDILGIGLIIVGAVLFIVGWIMLLVAAFREGILWGLACLFIHIVILIFIIIHWSEAKRGFLIYLGGWVLAIVGFVMAFIANGHVTIQTR